jgi:undecaprenyl-diphosphatase
VEDLTVIFFASFFIYFLFLGLIILWFIDGKIKKEQVVHALFACLIAWFIAYVIKQLFPTLRPYWLDGRGVMTWTVPTDGSFPSQHTALAFALSTTVFLHDRRVGWIFMISALLIGIARVLANVHYPVDILGGALIGTLVAVVIEKTHLFKLLTISRR